jgi:hypothetical protein
MDWFWCHRLRHDLPFYRLMFNIKGFTPDLDVYLPHVSRYWSGFECGGVSFLQFYSVQTPNAERQNGYFWSRPRMQACSSPKPLRWWQGSELRNSCDTPMIYRYRPESWSAFEAQISDDRTDRSLEALLKCSCRHSPVPGWKREGSQRAYSANTPKSTQGIRSPDQSHPSSRFLESSIQA